MKVAFVVYNHMTALDLIGIYDPITRLKSMGFLPELEWEICAFSEAVSDHHGLKFSPTYIGRSLEGFDLLIVPGGISALVYKLTKDNDFVGWLKTANSCQLKASVCTGSLLLGAAGFLSGKRPQPIRMPSIN